MLPYVSVGDFYSQGDNCLELLRDANELAQKTGLSYKTTLVYLLDSAGIVFNYR